jgi:hypothetical protein
LIGSPNGKGADKKLYGVEYYLRNFRNFLTSSCGGEWHNNEIVELDNPSSDEVFRYLEFHDSDYRIVYFSGHGYISVNYDRMIRLKDRDIKDTDLISNRCHRTLIIIDACRNFVPTIEGLPGEILFPSVDAFDGPIYREKLELAIGQSKEGCKIIHASKMGEYSFDTSIGAVFTSGLLNSMRALCNKFGDDSSVTIEEALILTRHKIDNQRPKLVECSGNLSIPFAFKVNYPFDDYEIALPQRVSLKGRKTNNIQKKKLSIEAKFLFATVLLIAFSNWKDENDSL